MLMLLWNYREMKYQEIDYKNTSTVWNAKLMNDFKINGVLFHLTPASKMMDTEIVIDKIE